MATNYDCVCVFANIFVAKNKKIYININPNKKSYIKLLVTLAEISVSLIIWQNYRVCLFLSLFCSLGKRQIARFVLSIGTSNVILHSITDEHYFFLNIMERNWKNSVIHKGIEKNAVLNRVSLSCLNHLLSVSDEAEVRLRWQRNGCCPDEFSAFFKRKISQM